MPHDLKNTDAGAKYLSLEEVAVNRSYT